MKVTNVTAKELREWLTVSQAARVLGVSRQAVNYGIARGQFRTLRVIGERLDGERPLYVIRRSEVEQVARRREEEKA